MTKNEKQMIVTGILVTGLISGGFTISQGVFSSDEEYVSRVQSFEEQVVDEIEVEDEILEQEEILTPMRKSDCERITSTFFSILRRSYDEGHLIIKGRNDDVFV